MTLEETQRAIIEAAIASHNGNVTKAAAELGISARTIRRRRRRWLQADARTVCPLPCVDVSPQNAAWPVQRANS